MFSTHKGNFASCLHDIDSIFVHENSLTMVFDAATLIRWTRFTWFFVWWRLFEGNDGIGDTPDKDAHS